ncbi:DUF6621 family protein [Bacteroides propionicifaciens]|uniref:DUF6621 family protein n=1 Tax=Bacteroides propionicifaciens TaxID=392838 RepID=UPI00037F70E5|nr:DUF6621 family protein [Bacteroides propionicifaciens]
MEKKIKLAETVILVDAAYLNFMLVNLKGFLEQQVNRDLSVVSMADLLTYIALDAQIQEGGKAVQVILISDDSTLKLQNAEPSDLKTELDGVAFKSTIGEFMFSTAFTEGLVSREELFLDVLEISLESEDVKKLVVLSFDDEYGDAVLDKINKEGLKKEIIQFRMRELTQKVAFKSENLVFPLMKAFGISADEIK